MCVLINGTHSLRFVNDKPVRLSPRAAVVLAVALLIAMMQPQTARAQHGGGGGGWHGGGAWNGGSWHQGWYGSRFGWWWVVPDFGWFAYDTPVYPYPDPDAYTQAMSAIPYWYYCQDPAGYYPYVMQCSGPWQPVPAQPAPAPAYPLAPGYSLQPSYAPQAGGSGNSTASDLNRQELNRLGAAPVNPL